MRVHNLNLVKELIILDFESKEIMQDRWQRDKENGFPKMIRDGKIYKPILNGLELTEEDYRSLITDGDGGISISKHPSAYLISYSRHKNGFKDVIENKGLYWLENPLGEYRCESGHNGKLKNSCIDSCQGSCWDIDSDEWEKSELRTLKFPIIFEILE